MAIAIIKKNSIREHTKAIQKQPAVLDKTQKERLTFNQKHNWMVVKGSLRRGSNAHLMSGLCSCFLTDKDSLGSRFLVLFLSLESVISRSFQYHS